VLKVKHPGTIAREREKRISDWESVRTIKYSSGVEYHVLIGALPHGNFQTAITANRKFELSRDGHDLNLEFSEESAPLVDFAAGERLTDERDNLKIIDSCYFVPTANVEIVMGGKPGEKSEDGGKQVTTFADGTTVVLHPHGGHAHVEPRKNGNLVKTFYNGKENRLYVFEESGAVEN
jgi:hypothetical protein